ncbi:MAG TPA: hypothetical protein DDZ88_25360 [Verrucomicrobiales bacterium]|nr:hypothetical protein [Verrucomicrobiales bacterium]
MNDIERRLTALERRLDLYPAHPAPAAATASQILNLVCTYFGVSRGDLLGPCRSAELVWPRHCSIYLLRIHQKLTYKHIAKIFRRDLGAVHHSVRSVENRVATDRLRAAQLQHLIESLKLE